MASHDTDVFIRHINLESCNIKLTFIQKKVGDVSCVVWDAAIVLAKYLDFSCKKQNYLQNKKILELGAGLGCAGLTAACLGANVILTDLENALPMLIKNIEVNEKCWKTGQGFAEGKILKWGEEINFDFKPDIIFLTDCIYYEESIDPLLDTLKNLLSSYDVYAILSQEARDTPKQMIIWEKFLQLLNLKFKTENIPLSEQHPTYSSSDIYLIKIFKK